MTIGVKRYSLEAKAIEPWKPLLDLLLQGATIERDGVNANSESHLIRDAIRAAYIHNVEPYNKLFRRVTVKMLNNTKLRIIPKNTNRLPTSIKLDQLITEERALELLGQFIAGPVQQLIINTIATEQILAFIEVHNLAFSIRENSLVIIKRSPVQSTIKE